MKKYIFLIFIILISISFNFISYTLASYIDNLNKNIKVSVAKWDFLVETTSDSVDIVSENGFKNYYIDIKNLSEVAAYYDIILSNVPNDIYIALNDDNYKNSNNNYQIIFDNNEIKVGEDIKNILKIKSSLEADELDNYEIDLDINIYQKKV